MSMLTTLKDKMDSLPLWLRRALWAGLGVVLSAVAARYGLDVTQLLQ